MHLFKLKRVQILFINIFTTFKRISIWGGIRMITYECEPVKKIKPRKLNHKANRKAKVYRGSGYNYKQVPQIKL